MLQDASELQREPVAAAELMMSIKCGESDTTSGLGSCPTTSEAVDRHVAAGGTVLFGETSELTGGEQLIAARCVDDGVRKKFQDLYDGYLERIESQGANLLGSQPTQGNIRGGLSTIEEKAMGNIAKTGTVPVVAALEPAEAPDRARAQLHGHLVGGRRVHHPDGGGRRGRSTSSRPARATSSATRSSRSSS